MENRPFNFHSPNCGGGSAREESAEDRELENRSSDFCSLKCKGRSAGAEARVWVRKAPKSENWRIDLSNSAFQSAGAEVRKRKCR